MSLVIIILFLLSIMFITRGLWGSWAPPSKQEIYRTVLVKTKKALDSLHIPFFLSSGTCLGYARERNFMEHDYDIDIGIFEQDYTPKILEAMKRNGLEFYRAYGSINTGLELSFYLPGENAKIDIFVHNGGTREASEKNSKEEKTCWFSYSKEAKKLEYCVSKFTLVPVDFLGVQVNVPEPLKRYLEEHYGDDWRIPKSNGTLGEYSYSSSPKSLVSN